ncbi:PEP-CTERM system histidine kinase PrsK [Motiliproteus coralliicola]|uniref:histidine kinase n=1 Tax=Motiliproteus coralliicola TaxID=2283196 RepID=A0A369WW62_9GAMM|nr:XrtA/PEP-CTERM system histidine kinase PrsK [Motiliproteus coralliicola]RDE24786.1 PEP-CTERM system histidine kinase PrsK [Motiliproteus coralliicola]
MVFFGFHISAVVFLTVFILCLAIWRERLLGIWIQLALFTTVLWAGYLGFASSVAGPDTADIVFLEILRNTAWLLFLLKLVDFCRGGQDFWSLKTPWVLLFFSLAMMLFNLGEVVGFHYISNLNVSVRYFGPLVLIIALLVVAEQWFRNIPSGQRWPVKFLLVSIYMMFGYDFLLYSEALLFNRIDPEFWQARGYVAAMAAPMIAISVSRTRDWNRELRVSRQAVFFSATFLLSGLYLLVMSLVGYYLKWFGGGMGNAVQIIFLVAALTLFVLLVSSGRFRSLVTVWLNKHFLSYKYDYRDEWMQANARFASLPMDVRYYQELLLGITEPLDSNGGVLWISEGEHFRAEFSSNIDCNEVLSPLTDQQLLEFVEKTGWVVNLNEYCDQPDLYNRIEIRQELLEKDFWLLVPLLHQGRLVGIAGLAQPRAEHPVNWEDFDLLKALASQLAAMIELKRTSESLSEARQFEAFNQLSAFIVHDLKNIVAQLALVEKNAQKHRHNPEFIDDAMDTLGNAVGRMNRLLSQLRKQTQVLVNNDVVDLHRVAETVVQRQAANLPFPTITEYQSGVRVRVESERFTDVLCHLVQNAQDATQDSGEVSISIEKQGSMAVLKVRDNGCGMDREFVRDRLFKPFDTTKGSAGMGIGVYEAKQFINANDGRLEVDSEPQQGTSMSILLPLFQEQDQRELSESEQGA